MKLSVIPYPNHIALQSGVYRFENRQAVQPQELDDQTLGEEAYRLQVTAAGVSSYASGAQGFFYARQTLAQMLDTAQGELPCCVIEDAPRFGYRGFMLDCVRHFFPVSDLKKMIAACAKLKMNRFHWHLTDDQGWRLQIDRYPALTERASMRPYSDFGRYSEQEPHGGYYTKEQVREVLDFCKERFIEVIPEVEMPGHASAILSVMPELSCDGKQVAIKTRGGVFHDTVCIGNPQTKEVLCHILDEVIALFPGDTIHLGGDEAPKTHWKTCPKCQALMQKEHLANESELQCFFTNQMADYLKQHGKKAVVWNDALRGGRLHPDITVQYWIGDGDAPVQHVNRGGQMVMSNYYHYYLDYSYGQTPLAKTYRFEPVPEGLQPGRVKNVIGVEAPIWAEYVWDLNKMAFQCFPRMLAVAESGWTAPAQKDEEWFHQRARAFQPTLKQMGLIGAEERFWNMGHAGRIKNLADFWYHSITWNDAKAFVKQLRDQKKE